MRRILLLGILATLALAGCPEAAPPPPPAPEQQAAPPDPSPDQYFSDLKTVMQVLFDVYQRGKPGISAEELNKVLSESPAAVSSCRTDNGRVAKAWMQRDLRELMRQARKENKWRLIKVCCQVMRIIDPQDDTLEKWEREANLMYAKPDVHLRGFMDVDGEPYVFLEVVDTKTTGKIKTYKVREGEIFHDCLRLARIIGDQASVEVEYSPKTDEDDRINYSWIVKGPRTNDIN